MLGRILFLCSCGPQVSRNSVRLWPCCRGLRSDINCGKTVPFLCVENVQGRRLLCDLVSEYCQQCFQLIWLVTMGSRTMKPVARGSAKKYLACPVFVHGRDVLVMNDKGQLDVEMIRTSGNHIVIRCSSCLHAQANFTATQHGGRHVFIRPAACVRCVAQ